MKATAKGKTYQEFLAQEISSLGIWGVGFYINLNIANKST